MSAERILTIRCPDWPVPVPGSAGPDPARRFEPVIRALSEVTPQLDLMMPGWVCLAARGPARRLGGESALAGECRDLVRSFIPETMSVGVGVADGRHTADVAAYLAVGREPLIIPPGDAAQFLAPLPLGWLARLGEVPAETIGLWAHLGVRTYGDLAAMDPLDLQGRFGPLGQRAHVLACGGDPRPVGVVEVPAGQDYSVTVDEPVVHLEAVGFMVVPVADRLESDLAAVGQVCTRLGITFDTDHAERSQRIWYLGSGLRRTQILERVRWQLEGWARGHAAEEEMTAGVVTVRLDVLEARADTGVQDRFWGGRSRADEAALRCISRLTAMIGPEGVRAPVWQGGRLPAERYRWVPAVDAGMLTAQASGVPAVWVGSLPAPSPLRVHPEPMAIEVHDVQGRPVTVSGRGELSSPPAKVMGPHGAREVVGWAGPWPMDQRWWERAAARRLARMQMLLADADAVLVVREHGRWWIVADYA